MTEATEVSEVGPSIPPVPTPFSPLEQALTLVRAGYKLVSIYPPNLGTPNADKAKGSACTCEKGADCGSPGKHPIGKQWQHAFFKSEDHARDALGGKSRWSVGFACGVQLNGLYVVAVDIDSTERFAELERELGPLPATAASESARGKKLFFTVPRTVDWTHLKNSDGLGKIPGVDVKIQGGQVVAPPSIHALGKPYTWVRTGSIAELPATWILALSPKSEPLPEWVYEPRGITTNNKLKKRAHAWLETKIAAQARKVADCGKGLRNKLLLHAAESCFLSVFGLQGLSLASPAEEDHVRIELAGASRASGLPLSEIQKTIKNAHEWAAKKGGNIPKFLRVIDGGGGAVDSIPPPAATEDAPVAAPSPPLREPPKGADRLARVADLQNLPEPWMNEIIWQKLSEGRGEEKITWYIPKSCIANATTILAHDVRWKGVIARDDFKEAEVMLTMPPWHPSDLEGAVVGPWTDADITRLAAWFEHAYEMNLRVSDIDRVVAVSAERNRFHPVREYLSKLVWDEVPRLDEALFRYFGAEDTPYSRAIGSRWLKSAVARVLWPGAQVDCTLVFEGRQGIGKNRAIRALVPDPTWVSETRIDIGNKDGLQSLRGKWIIFLDELDALRGKEISKVKSFLTVPKDFYRDSYGKRCRDFWRQCVFAGSTNEDEWLLDTSGNRRFWPAKIVRAIDADTIAAIRDQLWAEAYHRVMAGETWHVDTAELRALCEEEQVERVHEEPWTAPVSRWLAKPVDAAGNVYDLRDGVLTTDIATKALGIEVGRVSKFDVMRISSILKGLGYERLGLRRENGSRVRRWTKPSK